MAAHQEKYRMKSLYQIGVAVIMALLVSLIFFVTERTAALQNGERLAWQQAERVELFMRLIVDTTPGPVGALLDRRQTDCSPDALDAMRKVLFSEPLFHDVFVLENKTVVCSALLSRMETTVDIGRNLLPSLEQRGLYIVDWSTFGYQTAFLTRYDNLGLLIDPQVLNPGGIDGVEIFYTFEDRLIAAPGDLETQKGWRTLETDAEREICLKTAPLCITPAINDRVLLFGTVTQRLLRTLFVFAAAGALIGAGLGAIGYARRRRSPEQRALRCLQTRDYTFHFQPIVCASSGEMVGAEALFRPGADSRDLGIPFLIGTAEDKGLSGDIAVQAIQTALHDIIPKLRVDDFFVSINLTPGDLGDDALLATISSLVESAQVPAQVVHLEITERNEMPSELLQQLVARWRGQGFRIAIDDFGTGYQNLSRLASIRVDEIKIDRVFTNAVGMGSVQEFMLERLLEMVATSDQHIVVEGIETQSQHEFFQGRPNMRCQGWFYAKPMSAKDFLAWSRENRGDAS